VASEQVLDLLVPAKKLPGRQVAAGAGTILHRGGAPIEAAERRSRRRSADRGGGAQRGTRARGRAIQRLSGVVRACGTDWALGAEARSGPPSRAGGFALRGLVVGDDAEQVEQHGLGHGHTVSTLTPAAEIAWTSSSGADASVTSACRAATGDTKARAV
jgi:hypothetical protein